MNRLTDEFLEQIAAEYQSYAPTGRPSIYIADQRGASVATVRRWVCNARERGIMPPGVPGRVTLVGTPGAPTAAELVGAHCRRLRLLAGLSQEEAGVVIAERLGGLPWSRQAVSAAEKGRRGWAADEVRALAECFDVTPGSLFEPVPACGRCGGTPPEGFACTTCGASTPDP